MASASASIPRFNQRRPIVVPVAVAAREELPFCGHETIERTALGDLRDAEVWSCFFDAYESGKPAEMISDGLTVEGGRFREIYRLPQAGGVEWFMDATQDPLGAQAWIRFTCARLGAPTEAAEGVLVAYPDGCDDGTTVVGTDADHQPTGAEMAVLEHLIGFAQTSDPWFLDQIPLSTEGVWLGFRDRLLELHPPADLSNPRTWQLEVERLGDRTLVSGLDGLADWDLGTGADPPIRELVARVGEHPRCLVPVAEGPEGPTGVVPPEVEDARHVSVQPWRLTSCEAWWSVDLFFDDDGSIRAITLDV
jgi:hypothetical protein